MPVEAEIRDPYVKGNFMHLSSLSIRNFRNFLSVDIPLAGNIVLLGENRVGKSNLLFAIRLVLDPTLPDSMRQLKLSDFWDGCDLTTDPKIEVHLDFADFDSDDMLVDVTTSGLKGLGVFTYWLYGFSEINSYETNALRNYRRFEFLFGSDGLLAIENAADYERIKHFVATVVITARLVAQ